MPTVGVYLMNRTALMIHVAVCLVIGGTIAFFTSAKWIAAAFWVSGALYINGSIAYVEDGRPGGFDNPDGNGTPDYAEGYGALLFAIKSLFVTIALVAIGVLVQLFL